MVRLPIGRDFRLIWTAGIVSQLGDWSARLALALLVLQRGGTAVMVGVIGMLFVAPWLGIGQALTALSTRFGRRVVLIACDSFRGIAFVVIGTWSPPTVPLLVIVGLAALADPVFEATKSAFVTEIVPKHDYSEAIQMTQVANQSASLIGYALGGVIVGLVGAEATLNLNGFTFLVSALLLILVSQPGVQEAPSRVGASIGAGLGFLRTDRISAVGFYVTVLSVATAMSVESQAAVYGKLVAAFSDQTIGLLSAITPAATLVAVALMKTSGDEA